MRIDSDMPNMKSSIQNELDFIAATIKANTAPELIYLFGSYANGVLDNDSDIDIYVVVPDSDCDTIKLCAKINFDLTQKRTLPVDLLIEKKVSLKIVKTD